MITVHNTDDTFMFYASMGARRVKAENGFCYIFPDQASFVRVWGDLHGFSAATADLTYPKDIIARSQFKQRYIGIGFNDEGSVVAYSRKNQLRHLHKGINCYVVESPSPFFMKINAGERLRFRALYFQESFFVENGIKLYGSFWRDAKQSISSAEIHSPELVSIFRRIENCRLKGMAFDTWIRGQGLAAVGHIMDLVQQYSVKPPIYLDEGEMKAIEKAKSILRSSIQNTPTILEICKKVGMNKNKLQEGFRLTEGKSIAEYVRAIRMERTLELLDSSDLSMQKIAKAVGYHGVSNFYTVFNRTFGETPAAIQKMFKKRPAAVDQFDQ